MRTRQLERPTTPRRRGTEPRAADLADERRARCAGGPEDAALYACSCGTAFRADVTASVACPACGADQAW